MLTDEERREICQLLNARIGEDGETLILGGANAFFDSIERAVMKKLGEQEPVGIIGEENCLHDVMYKLPIGTKLYAHPLPAPAVPEWTDRSKIAPKRENGDKILAFGEGYVFEAECDEEGDWCSIGGDDFTHWMPMLDTSMLSAAKKP